MNKKVFIYIRYFEPGGVERALIGLLEMFVQTEHKVVFYCHQGELMPHIPAGINLLPEHPSYGNFCSLKSVLFSLSSPTG